MRTCKVCITVICLFLIDVIAMAEQTATADDDPIKRESTNSDSENALWLKQAEEKCQLGDFPACSQIGAMYKSLNNSKLFWFYYEKACTGLHAESCAKLGDILTQGDGLILDQQAGRYFYAKACDLGNKPSCEIIGWNSSKNATCITDNDPEKCRALACEKQDAGHTCLIIGTNYYNGSHSSGKNDVFAAAYFKKACTRKNGNGCLNLANLYLTGAGVKTNEEKALQYYMKGCLYDNATACQYIIDWASENSIVGKKVITK